MIKQRDYFLPNLMRICCFRTVRSQIGKKVMSGTLLLLAQLYPIKEAFHLSILNDELSQDIEDHGHWERLNILEHKDHGKYQRILFPNAKDVEVLVLPIDKCPVNI